MSNRLRFICVFLLLCVPLAQVWAAPSLQFSKRVIPLTPGPNGIAFFTVVSPVDDEILSVSAACCEAAELHTHEMKGDVMQMRRVDSVPLKANVPTAFASGGLHIMLVNIKKPMVVGDTVTLVFTLAHAGQSKQVFTVTDPRLH